jgi:nucleoside-diphosphate-sugar epimerase
MKILVTSGASAVGRLVASALAGTHDVSTVDLPANASSGISGHDLDHDEATDELVAGVDVVIHPGWMAQEGDAPFLIDYHTRRTYNLLRACVDQGVSRAIYLSTLQLMDGYPERMTVSERWKPLPSTDDQILATHLGETVFKEYAREEPISTMVIRAGFPLIDGNRGAASESGHSAALATGDLTLAISRAIEAEWSGWNVLHVQSPVPEPRYLMGAAQTLIGYPEPKDTLAGEGAAR